MQSSIQGPLLRSGQNSVFKALGETGYPVFRMAFQLREAIQRFDSGRNLARHLAIPHNNQTGDQTDWYSSFPGDVVPWANATEVERASASQQFEVLQNAIASLSEQFLAAGDRSSGGDRRAFAQLLKLVVNFPDQDFVYLVNGVLVITFWGFIHKEEEMRDPMHWLRPAPLPALALESMHGQPVSLAPVTGSSSLNEIHSKQVIETRQIVRTQASWWRSWRWLLWPLLLLLGLLLALFLLRGCVPSLSLPGLPTASIPALGKLPTMGNSLPELSGANVKPALDNMGHPVSAGHNINSSNQPRVPNVERPNQDLPPSTDGSLKPPLGSEDIAKAEPNIKEPPASQKAEPTDKTTPSLDSHPSQQPPSQPPQSKPLHIPPKASDGPATFLNGDWKVNGGIQDKQTGKPLQLEYTFKDGVGSVSLRQSNGVLCNGTANGTVGNGILNISNNGQANCNDGSSYMIPDIECRSSSTGNADCMGRNDGERQFPIRMLQHNS